MQVTDDRLVSTNEAAEVLGVGRSRLFEFINRDDNPIPCYQEKPGGKLRFRVPEILDWYSNEFRRV